ncbi:MAG: hypothetical protein J6A59_00685, partial [Lachnospiraceae bacterium]|nr:hypothetical protein [Lachnospiraceae bacterium]
MGVSFNNISDADRNSLNNRDNPPEFESEFDGMGGDDNFDNLDFGDFGGFGSDDDSGFGSDPFSFGNDSNSTGSLSNSGNGFGQNSFGGFGQTQSFGGFGQESTLSPFNQNNVGPFGMQNNQTQGQQNQKDTMDQFYEDSVDAAKSLWHIIMDLIKSIKTRNADDLGYLSASLIKIGAVIAGVSVGVGIVGSIIDFRMLKFTNWPLQILLSGLLVTAFGLIAMGIAMIALVHSNEATSDNNIDSLEDASSLASFSDATDMVNDSIGAQLDDLFDDDDLLDSLFPEDEDGDDMFSTDNKNDGDDEEDLFIPKDEDLPPINYEEALDNIRENQLINRETLVNTFLPLLPLNTPGFAKCKKLAESDNTYINIRICMLKALARVTGTTMEEVDSEVLSIEDSFFSFTIIMRRINKCNKLDDIAREVERYMRESSTDTSVNATVTIEGDNYKIVVTKGATAVVTFGDVFKQQYVKDFYMNKKNKLPIIQGIDELGNVLIADAKSYDTMLIAGKPRSGKSWYVLSILISLMMFNTPDDVQFIIIDPKESNLFKTMALMPHVCGLHDNKRIIQILDDIIENEAPRRKKLFKDHRVDDIWALRNKGINLPVLYIVIDEYITVRNDLGDEYKELDRRLQVLISQLPSQGIRLLFVPHRATGIVDRTNRSMLQYTAAVRASNEDIIDTLDLKKWTRPLVNPGDIAIKSSSVPDGTYVRGAALTTDDGDNAVLIENIAKAFYKMGVEIPDMATTMKIACNRDDDYIREELSIGGRVV